MNANQSLRKMECANACAFRRFLADPASDRARERWFKTTRRRRAFCIRNGLYMTRQLGIWTHGT